MRNRIYITSIEDTSKTESQCIQFSKEHLNIVIFVPHLKSIYLNGVRYGSVNKLSDIYNKSLLFEVDENDNNQLVVQPLTIEDNFNCQLTLLNRTYTIEKGVPLTITMTVGDVGQMFFSRNVNFFNNKVYFWVSNDMKSVIVDRNNIIHAIKPKNNCRLTLRSLHNSADILLQINVIVNNTTNVIDYLNINDNATYSSIIPKVLNIRKNYVERVVQEVPPVTDMNAIGIEYGGEIAGRAGRGDIVSP